MTRRAWILFAAMGIMWGIPYLFIKIAVAGLTPATVVFLRTAIGAALLLPLAQRRGALAPLIGRWRPLCLYTLSELCVPWILLSDAERTLSSSLVGIAIAAVPAVTLVLAAVTGQDRGDVRRGAGLLVGFAGVVALVGLSGGSVAVRPVAELALVVIGYAGGAILIGGALADLPPLGVVAGSLGLAAAVYAVPGILTLPARMPPPAVWLSVAVLGLVCTAAAFLAMFALIAAVGPVRATVVTYVNPAVAAVLGVAVLGERLTWGMVAGFALILVGSLIATRRSGTTAVAPAADA